MTIVAQTKCEHGIYILKAFQGSLLVIGMYWYVNQYTCIAAAVLYTFFMWQLVQDIFGMSLSKRYAVLQARDLQSGTCKRATSFSILLLTFSQLPSNLTKHFKDGLKWRLHFGRHYLNFVCICNSLCTVIINITEL